MTSSICRLKCLRVRDSARLVANSTVIGYLGSLQLRIPWANLKTQPVRVLIGDLFVLAGPRTETEVQRESVEGDRVC